MNLTDALLARLGSDRGEMNAVASAGRRARGQPISELAHPPGISTLQKTVPAPMSHPESRIVAKANRKRISEQLSARTRGF